jgi:hypothetical protein
MTVNCKVKELEAINRRLLELASDVQEFGEDRSCKLKLGGLELNLTVEYDHCLQSSTMKSLLNESKLDESINNISMISHI